METYSLIDVAKCLQGLKVPTTTQPDGRLHLETQMHSVLFGPAPGGVLVVAATRGGGDCGDHWIASDQDLLVLLGRLSIARIHQKALETALALREG